MFKIKKSLTIWLSHVSERKNPFPPRLLQNLSHGKINGAAAADDPFPSCDFTDTLHTGPVSQGKQEEEDPQAKEDKLKDFILVPGPDPHHEGEYAPHEEVPAQECIIRSHTLSPADVGEYKDRYQRKPEESIRGECGGSEGVPFFELHNAGNDLGNASVKDAHGEDHIAHREKAGIMDVQKNSGHPKAHQAQGCGIRKFTFHTSQ